MAFNKLKHILVFYYLLVCIGTETKAQQLNIKNIASEEGLPQLQINCLLQDHAGNIWIATNNGGVSRYNGINFTNYDTHDGLKNIQVFTIFEDVHENIWFGTADGVSCFRNNKMFSISEKLIKSVSVYSIQQFTNGEMWFGTSAGIIIYDGKSLKNFPFNNDFGNFQVIAIKPDKLGNVWIASNSNGLFCYDGKHITRIGTKEGLADLKTKDIIIDDTQVLVATTKGVSTIDIQAKPYIAQPLLIGKKPFIQSANCFYKRTDGSIYIGTNNGIGVYNSGKIKFITSINGLCGNEIKTIISDKEDNLWIGTENDGISIYKNPLFLNINQKEGLVSNDVNGFFKDSKGRLWITTANGGLSRMNLKSYHQSDSIFFQNYIQQKNGLASNNITGICEDKKGNIIVGTANEGLCVFKENNWTRYTINNGLHGLHILALLTDIRGNVWIGNETGIEKYDGTHFTYYGKTIGLSAPGVNAIFDDEIGNIWFGSNDKIIKYDGKAFTSIALPEGFNHIKNISKDKLGYMWFSTDAGAYVYNGRTFKVITQKDGLASSNVRFIKPDDIGDLWIGTTKGIDKLDIDKYINQKDVILRHFGKEEGFTGLECNQGAFYKDANGLLWIGTSAGITICDPKHDKINKIEPQTYLTDIRLFLENIDFTKFCDSLVNGIPQNLHLPYNKNHLTFNFIGISHTNPTKVKYKYKLDGADKDWSPEVTETYTTYPNLQPGKYTFFLKAANSDGIWTQTPLSYTFEIVPPFWKQNWFYLLCIIVGAAILFLYVRIRERGLVYSRKIMERQVNVRTKELLEEKEKLQEAYSDIDEKNKDITDSIHYAKRLQSALLPTDNTMKQLLPESFVLFKPKDIVSGDFYWIEQWGHQILVAAADCTGHGVPGAFMSIVAHNIITQTVNVLGLSKPALILNETNKQLSRKLNQNSEEATVRDGMDIALVAINYTKNKMEYSGANNPVWIIRNNEVIEVTANKFPIGAFIGEELQKFNNHEWELQKGDYIYIFTDGFADQFGGPKGKKFKYKPFQQLLLDNHKKPMVEQRNVLERTIEEWRGELEQVDDILVIGFRV